ncbi:hypothetical protein [Nonomuraea helvata]|uniref:Uncharacterized protein n=1 Tax=Nonomuraea helvata TaxID=37484 RepID=A0ABV5S9V5_9ACTN
MLLEQVRNNAEYVREAAQHLDVVELRFYDLRNLYRIILTDEVAYITLYGDTEHGRNSPCVVARPRGCSTDSRSASSPALGRPAAPDGPAAGEKCSRDRSTVNRSGFLRNQLLEGDGDPVSLDESRCMDERVPSVLGTCSYAPACDVSDRH